MKQVRVLFIGLLMMAVVLLGGCTDDGYQSVVFPVQNAAEDTPPRSGMLLHDVVPTPIESAQLFGAADVIVEAKVLSRQTDPALPDAVFVKVKVLTVHKGARQPGEVLTVEERGQISDTASYSTDAVPLMNTGMRVLLFLTGQTLSSGQLGYGVYANYAGKFFFDTEGTLYPSVMFAAPEGDLPPRFPVTDITEPIPQRQLALFFKR